MQMYIFVPDIQDLLIRNVIFPEISIMNERIGDDQLDIRIEGPESECAHLLLRNNVQKELLRLPKHFVVTFH